MTLKEIAAEYRMSAAKLKVVINERIELGTDKSDVELRHLESVRRELVQIASYLDYYYDAPRNIQGFTSHTGISSHGRKRR